MDRNCGMMKKIKNYYGEVGMRMKGRKDRESFGWRASVGRILICMAVIAFATDAGAATRFYLQNATSSATLPATQGTWSYTTGAPTLVMSTTKSGTITSRGVAETNASNTYNVMLLKFVSDPIPAQTVSGTLDWVIGASESNAAANDYWYAHAYVVSSAGALRGTLLANSSENTTNEFSATAQGWGTQGPKTLSSVAASVNDRIVIEIGYIARNTVTTSYTGTLWYGGTGGDLSATGDETSLTGWFEITGLDLTPPVEGTLTVSPSTATHVPATFTIQKTFTEAESTVNLCEYTLNGSSWTSAGAPSGSSPNWTCTATPPAQTNGTNLTINMRATSTGGLSSVTGSLSRTVDTVGPTDGTLTVTPGGEQNVLNWTTADDGVGNAGLRTGSIYDVRFQTGSSPSCSSGTSIYTGDLLTYTHTGLVGGQQYFYRVCAYDNVNNASTGATGSGTPKYASTTTSCGRCHSYPPLDGTRSGTTGSVVGDHQPHDKKPAYVCSVCHQAPAGTTSAYYGHRNRNIEMQTDITGGTYTKGTSFLQINNPTTTACSNVACHGGNNPTPTWGGALPQCVQCHNGLVTALNASVLSGGTVTRRDNVISEFTKTWGHKKSGRGAVVDSDCIVCHLEGNYTTQKTSSKHADGYIDLRDPDGSGETPITDNSGGSFLFTKYSIAYTANTRTTVLTNSVADVITVKFCIACHDGNGATNPTAVTSYTTGTVTKQYMPFGGVYLGSNYTTTNGAVSAGGLINVAKQFLSTNSSRHPVGAPNYRAYPYSNRLLEPYNSFGTARDGNTQLLAGTGTRVLANSVILVCDDCHTTGTSLTKRMITSHGSSSTARGTYFVSGPTLCLTCHITGTNGRYNNTDTGAWPGGTHGAGSGFGTGPTRPAAAMNSCNFCHFSDNATYAAANRPRYAQDIHGFNELYGTSAGWTAGTANGMRPIAFMRSWTTSGGSWPTTHSPRPYVSTTTGPGQFNLSAGQAECGGVSTSFAFDTTGTGFTCSGQNHSSYGPGGSY